MSLLDRFRLILSLKSLADASKKEIRMNNWDWQITLKKALISLLTHGGAVLIGILVMLPDSSVNAWLVAQGVPPSIVAIATPLLMMGIRAVSNWWKNATPAGPPAPPKP